jgi:hypothetical protein
MIAKCSALLTPVALDILIKHISGEKISRNSSLSTLLFYPVIYPYFQALFAAICMLPPSKRKLHVNFESKPWIYFVFNK